MKRLIAALLLTVFMVSCCVFSAITLKNASTCLSDGIERCEELYDDMQYTECELYASKLEKKWVKYENKLSVFINNEKLEDIGESIALMKIAARLHDDEGFFSSTESAKVLLAHLKHQESFGI